MGCCGVNDFSGSISACRNRVASSGQAPGNKSGKLIGILRIGKRNVLTNLKFDTANFEFGTIGKIFSANRDFKLGVGKDFLALHLRPGGLGVDPLLALHVQQLAQLDGVVVVFLGEDALGGGVVGAHNGDCLRVAVRVGPVNCDNVSSVIAIRQVGGIDLLQKQEAL